MIRPTSHCLAQDPERPAVTAATPKPPDQPKAGVAEIPTGKRKVVGLFGVVADDVSRRRLELVLRLALGARPRQLQHRVVIHALLLLVPGIAGGALLWFARSPGLRAMLNATSPGAPTAVVLAIVIVICCGLGAAVIPAPRVARTSRFATLRGE